jgi:hypothetical protein
VIVAVSHGGMPHLRVVIGSAARPVPPARHYPTAGGNDCPGSRVVGFVAAASIDSEGEPFAGGRRFTQR